MVSGMSFSSQRCRSAPRGARGAGRRLGMPGDSVASSEVQVKLPFRQGKSSGDAKMISDDPESSLTDHFNLMTFLMVSR